MAGDPIRNDLRQYDELVDQWARPDGAFAMLHWLATARAALVPPAPRPDALLVDLGCGGGLLAPRLVGKGYRHVGVDLVTSALVQARKAGATPVRADVAAVPLRDGCADVVCAGELLEHVTDPRRVLSEACRLLRPGGRLVLDTIAATALARLIAVTIGERIPGGAPKGIHDPALFVPPSLVVDECARHGVRVAVHGVRPHLRQFTRWLLTRRGEVAMIPTWPTAVLYQAYGVKQGAPGRGDPGAGGAAASPENSAAVEPVDPDGAAEEIT
ncbi:MAG: methyltransferase domain-containing protein [Micromonosporaceae bacterium]